MEEKILENILGSIGTMQTALFHVMRETHDSKLDLQCDCIEDALRGIRGIINDMVEGRNVSPMRWTYIKNACERYNENQ